MTEKDICSGDILLGKKSYENTFHTKYQLEQTIAY